MATNKVKVQHERAKMKLQSDILNDRVKLEETRQRLASKRQQLRELKSSTK